MGNMNQNGYTTKYVTRTIANRIIMEKQPFERLIISKAELLEMFKYNKCEVHFIQEKVPDGTSSTVYRCHRLVS